ncbi:hypothetical protein EDB84DRAFT_1493270, partial [Lactarius hengduanensis]
MSKIGKSAGTCSICSALRCHYPLQGPWVLRLDHHPWLKNLHSHFCTLHSHAALETQSLLISDPSAPPLRRFCTVLKRARTTSDHLRLTDPFLFPTALHSCAALDIRHRHVYEHHIPMYGSLHPAEACATPCGASHPPNPAPVLDGVGAQVTVAVIKL